MPAYFRSSELGHTLALYPEKKSKKQFRGISSPHKASRETKTVLGAWPEKSEKITLSEAFLFFYLPCRPTLFPVAESGFFPLSLK